MLTAVQAQPAVAVTLTLAGVGGGREFGRVGAMSSRNSIRPE